MFRTCLDCQWILQLEAGHEGDGFPSIEWGWYGGQHCKRGHTLSSCFLMLNISWSLGFPTTWAGCFQKCHERLHDNPEYQLVILGYVCHDMFRKWGNLCCRGYPQSLLIFSCHTCPCIFPLAKLLCTPLRDLEVLAGIFWGWRPKQEGNSPFWIGDWDCTPKWVSGVQALYASHLSLLHTD